MCAPPGRSRGSCGSPPQDLCPAVADCHCRPKAGLQSAAGRPDSRDHGEATAALLCFHLRSIQLTREKCTVYKHNLNDLLKDTVYHDIKELKLQKIGMSNIAINIFLTHTLHMAIGFPGGSVSKETACNAGDLGSIPGSGRSPRQGNGNPLQNSCLGNPMDRGAWWATVHGVTRAA